MAHLCPKCNTLYHTDEEWTIHSGGNCYAHSMEDSPALPDFYKASWQEVVRIVEELGKKEVMSQSNPTLRRAVIRLRELLDEFESASSVHEMSRIKREIIKHLHELRDRP